MAVSAGPPGVAAGADAILAGLNDEQRAAVTHGEGPLLIVAGAGTGKTAVVTRRIAWLIATRRARPEQILALTFTDKAAAEMESRVDELVPYGLVGATIATFHAFCDRLVREHAVELGLTARLRVESQAEILVFLREHLFDLGLKRYLPLGAPDTHLRALTSVFDRARSEDVSPPRYRAFAEELLAAATDAESRDRAEAEREKAIAYERYESLLLTAGRVDFGAQISLALRLLRERPYLLREYRERFRWILVDEFQDTDHVQFELVRLLAGERPNLTVVGDDDQSIYRFRGAQVHNLLEVLECFPGTREVLLTRNYRSGQAILDRAHTLIRFNDPARLEAVRGYDKRLLAQRVEDGAPFAGAVEHRAFETASDQADQVADDIATALERGERRPGDFAVLARSHRQLDAFAQALRVRGVRFQRVGMRGLYSRPEVLLCLDALRTVADPDDSASVYMVLGNPRFGADPEDLARLGARARRTHRGLLDLAIAETRGDEAWSERTRDAVRRFAELHRTLTALAVHRPTSEVLYAFVQGSGLLDSLVADESPENLERAQNLNKLFGIVTRVGPLLQRDRVEQFIVHLDLLIEMGDDPAAAEPESDDEAVRLLTAHGAKGLEFPVVYLVDLVEQRFPQYPKGESLPFPPELRHAPGDEHEEHYREERRLFYVGMTRARDRLVLCHARDLGGKRAARPSRFVLEALGLPAPPKGARGASALESIARHAPVPEPAAAPLAPLPDDEPVPLSHTAVDRWLACPFQYYLASVAHVPLPASPVLMYGSALHHAIQVWHHHRMRGLPIEAADVVSAYASAWSNEGFLTPAHEERMFAQGREALERFVRRDLAAGIVPLAIEADFEFRAAGARVTGRFDRIDERAAGIVLVDYKSSEVGEAEVAAQRAKDSVRDGQLGLYALAYRETRGALPARVELDFVGSGITGSAAVEPVHLERALERIATAAAGIRAARFTPTPDARTCAHCDYRHICRHSAARGTT